MNGVWLTIIGVGEEPGGGIDAQGWAALREAELIVGGDRHLALVPDAASSAVRSQWGTPFSAGIDLVLARRGSPVVVLATGDPLDWGVAATLARHVDPAEIRVLPHLGAFSLAAARMVWPLNDMSRLTLHGRPIGQLALHARRGARIIALSRDGFTPSEVAKWLTAAKWGESLVTILEGLGGSEERISRFAAADMPEMAFRDLNTIAIEIKGQGRSLSRVAGLPDDVFIHDGQLTKQAVRAVTLAVLAPLPGEILWDVGAGCGSIALEWLRADTGMRAYAIEHHTARLGFIARNAEMLGVTGLEIIAGEAVDVLADLPCPDAVFIGGGLSETVLKICWDALRPGGRLVANVVTVEGELVLGYAVARLGGRLSRMAVSHAMPLGSHQAWRAAMPVCQYSVWKPA